MCPRFWHSTLPGTPNIYKVVWNLKSRGCHGHYNYINQPFFPLANVIDEKDLNSISLSKNFSLMIWSPRNLQKFGQLFDKVSMNHSSLRVTPILKDAGSITPISIFGIIDTIYLKKLCKSFYSYTQAWIIDTKALKIFARVSTLIPQGFGDTNWKIYQLWVRKRFVDIRAILITFLKIDWHGQNLGVWLKIMQNEKT